MHRLARGGLLNLVGAGVSSLAGLTLTVLVTRAMSKADAGAFFTLTSVFLLTEILVCLGTDAGLVYFISRMRALEQRGRIPAFQRVAIRPVLAASLLASGVLLACSPWILRLVGGHSGQARAGVIVLAALLPMAALSDTVLAATRGHGTMLPTVTLDRTGRSLLQLALVALAVGSGSLGLLAAGWALPWVASAVVALWWLRRLGKRLPPTGTHRTGRGTAREFWRFTWARGVNSIAQLVLQRADIVIIAALLGPAQAAVYTAATRFLVVGQLASTSIGNAAQPRLAELLALHDHGATRGVYQASTAWIVLLTWPLYLLCGVFADQVLRIFGSGYSTGQQVILVLVVAMLVATGCGTVDVLLNMSGRTTWTLANSVAAVVVMVGLDVLLIPRLGILGAGIGWAAAICTNNLAPLGQLMGALRLHPFGRATVIAASLATVCFGIVPGIARLMVPGNIVAALASIAVGALSFVALCFVWRDRLDLPALAALRPRYGRRAVPAGMDPTPSV